WPASSARPGRPPTLRRRSRRSRRRRPMRMRSWPRYASRWPPSPNGSPPESSSTSLSTLLTTPMTSRRVRAVAARGAEVGTADVRVDADRIVDAALEVANELGLAGMTMRRVGARLGVDPTACYRYFASKDDLMAAIAD